MNAETYPHANFHTKRAPHNDQISLSCDALFFHYDTDSIPKYLFQLPDIPIVLRNGPVGREEPGLGDVD